MGEKQNPEGVLGISRLTDVGPLVSHHRTEPTRCDVELAFGGNSKAEVFRSIRDAWIAEVDELEDDLRKTELDFFDIYITGSVVSGDFGCRDPDKASEEVLMLRRHWGHFAPRAEAAAEEIAEEESIMDMWRVANDILEGHEESEIFIEDTLTALISDIDVFITVPDQSEAIDLETDRDAELRGVMKDFKDRFSRTKKGRMPVLINYIQTDYPGAGEGVLQTEGDFNKIINRYY